MRRELIKVAADGGMAVVDSYRDIFERPVFHACILVEEMRPATICKTIGRFTSRQEAADAATAALSRPPHDIATPTETFHE